MVTRADRALGANLPVGARQVTLFIPDRDRRGKRIDQDHWVGAALDLLGELFRGATAFPPGRGVWRNDERGGELLREVTVIVTSYTNPRDHSAQTLARLAEFLHRFGREANQGEVGVVIGNRYFGITEYR